jgi:uncharacterized protein YukE
MADTEERLSQLRAASTKAWSQAEEDLQQAMNDLQEAYQQAAAAIGKAAEGEPESEQAENNTG